MKIGKLTDNPMKKIGSTILSCVLCLFMTLFLQAQNKTSIIAPTETLEPFTVYKAEVKVTNFDNIVGMQFTMNWDSTVLRFRSVESFVFQGETSGEIFNKNRASEGLLSITWFDMGLQSHDLDDSTTIFKLVFDVVGNAGSSSDFLFTDDITDRLIARQNGPSSFGENPTDYYNGLLSVGTPTSVTTYNSAPDKVQVENSFPNPFSDFTQIKFELKEATKAQLMIKDMKGQTVYETQQFLTVGAHQLTLTKDKFPGAGAYQFFIIAPTFTVAQKLIFL